MISAYDKGELDSFLNSTPEQKDYFTFGQAFHKWFLEPDDFWKEFVLASKRPEPAKSFGFTANKEWKLEIESDKLLVLKDQDFVKIQEMRDVVMLNPEVKRWMEHPAREVEKKIEWEVDGVQYKGRFDLRVGDTVIDFKTTNNCFKFEESIINYKYYRQASMYLDGAGADRFVIVPVEKRMPYLSAVAVMDDDLIEMGRNEYKQKGKEIWKLLMK